jgi:hypothetical protein
LGQEESSNPQRISKKWAIWDQEKTASLPYPVDGEWEDMAETILSYLLAEESSNPQKISKKMGGCIGIFEVGVGSF